MKTGYKGFEILQLYIINTLYAGDCCVYVVLVHPSLIITLATSKYKYRQHRVKLIFTSGYLCLIQKKNEGKGWEWEWESFRIPGTLTSPALIPESRKVKNS